MKTEVRAYTLKDVPGIVDGVYEHLHELPNYKNVTVSKERVAYLLNNNINNNGYFACWVVVNEQDEVVGGGGGFCTPGMMTWDLIANDIFLYVVPEYRSLHTVNKLINNYKVWATARDAKLIIASHTGGVFPEGSREAMLYDAILKRHGFDPVGTVYHLNRYATPSH